ncbi:unnamed protein product, partial [Scytosiphon promiscuus]
PTWTNVPRRPIPTEQRHRAGVKSASSGAAGQWRDHNSRQGVLQTVLKGMLTDTARVLQQLRTCSGINILDVYPQTTAGHFAGQFPVADSFDLACTAILNMLKLGLDPAL